MNWNKAKNLTIISLTILNIFLGVLLYVNSTRYVITSAQQQAILSVLSRNNIYLYTQIIKEYPPMKNLILLNYNLNNMELVDLLFNNAPDVKLIEGDTNLITYTDTSEIETLILNGSSFIYETKGSDKKLALHNFNEIRNYANDYVKIFDNLIPDLFLDNTIYEDNEIILQYRQLYKNNIIQNNYIFLHTTKDGIHRIEGNYHKPIELQDAKNEICSPDEALFVLMQYLNTIFVDKKIFINKMNIVYFYNDTINDDNDVTAVPYYRFNTSEANEYFLVNALTSAIHEIE